MNLYLNFFHGHTDETLEDLEKEYNEKLSDLIEKYNIKCGVLDFVYKEDTHGHVAYTKCKHIYDIIKDVESDTKYGYVGRDDCVKSKSKLEWY